MVTEQGASRTLMHHCIMAGCLAGGGLVAGEIVQKDDVVLCYILQTADTHQCCWFVGGDTRMCICAPCMMHHDGVVCVISAILRMELIMYIPFYLFFWDSLLAS